MADYDPRPFEARFNDALAFLAQRFDERDGFLSDSDILDAADTFVDVPRPHEDAPDDDPLFQLYYVAHGQFAEALFTVLSTDDEEAV